MEPTDVTIEILEGIRDEARKTSEGLTTTNEHLVTLVDRIDRLDDRISHLDESVERLDGRVERLEKRQVETEVRLATELAGVAGAVREVRDVLREDCALRLRVDDHERRLTAIEQRRG
jgi:predicted  nucleic acid-binding Zn-ribbon protein